jgi:hypothetical protein
MNTENRRKLLNSINLEVIWWSASLLMLTILLLPIYVNVPNFQFYGYNALFIVVFVTYTRYVFLLKYSWFAKIMWVKVVLALICPLLILVMVDGIHQFQLFMDEKGIESLMKDVPLEKWDSFYQYIRAEYLLFGVGSVIVAVILPIRMIISVWRYRNEGTV